MLSQLFFAIAALQFCSASVIHHQSPHGRIINGNTPTPNAYPYMVYIEINPHESDPKEIEGGGGSLITKSHVLTAAHCVEGKKTVNFVLLGAHDIEKKEPTQQKILASKVLIHHTYDKPDSAHDIAIIKLKSEAKLNKYVALIPLARDVKKTYVGETALAMGWGLIHDQPKPVFTDVLKAVSLKVISNKDCLKKAPDQDVYDGDLCTDGTGTKGTCSGDSGGPLVLNNALIGVTSRGATEFCEKNDPSVYVRVTSYLTWIDDAIKKM